MTNVTRQFWVVFNKNFWYRRRGRPFVMILEVVWPAFLFAVVISVRQGSPAEERPQCIYPSRALPSAGALQFLQSHACNVNKICLQHEAYKRGTIYENMMRGSSQEEEDEPVNIGSYSDTGQFLPLIPKLLTLFGKLSDTISEPEVERYLNNGPPKKVSEFLVNQTVVEQYLLEENYGSEELINKIIDAELVSASSDGGDGGGGGGGSFTDLKSILCEKDKLKEHFKIPDATDEEYGQMSKEFCNLDHDLVPELSSIFLRQLETDDLTDELLGGVQTLTSYTTGDIFDDVAILVEAITELQLLEKFVDEFPTVGKLDDILLDVKDILLDRRTSRTMVETLELVAPLIGDILADEDYGDQLLIFGKSVDGIIKFINRQLGRGGSDIRVTLDDALDRDSSAFQLSIRSDVSASVRNRVLELELLPGEVLKLSDSLRLGMSWLQLTCEDPGFRSIFNVANDDDVEALDEVQAVICDEDNSVGTLVDYSRFLDYTDLRNFIDGERMREVNGIGDYFGLIADVTAATSSGIELGQSTVDKVMDIIDGVGDIGAKFRRSFEGIRFRTDTSIEYTAQDFLKIAHDIIYEADEFRPLAATLDLARQILISKDNNYAEFKSLFRDPGAIITVLLGSTQLAGTTLNTIFGQNVDTSTLFGLTSGKTTDQVASTLCSGGSFVGLFEGLLGGGDNGIGDTIKGVQDDLCKRNSRGMVSLVDNLDLNKLLTNQIGNLVPSYLMYGDWWADTFRDLNSIVEGVGAIMDLASGRRQFDARVFLKLIYHTIAALDVDIRSELSDDVPSLIGLVQDRIVEPPYFADDLTTLSRAIRQLSIFQRSVPLSLSVRENTKDTSEITNFLLDKGNFSPSVIENLLKTTLNFSLDYHIKDVEFNGAVCGPATVRGFLKFDDDVADEDLSELTSTLCSLEKQKLKDLASVIVPQLNIGGLVKSLLDISPTHLFQSSNLTKSETTFIVKNLGSLGNRLSGLLGTLGNRSETTGGSTIHSIGRDFCGDEKAFDFGSYGAALLSPPEDDEEGEGGEEEVVEEKEEPEPQWTPTQLKEIAEFNDTFCADLYKSINGLPGVGPVLWTFLKPLTQGRVLYSPNTPEATAIMKEAYWLFDSVKDVETLTETWVEFADNFDKNNEDRASRNKSSTFVELTEALKIPFVSQALEQAAGVTGEDLIDQLPNPESISDSELDQVTEGARSLKKVIKCLRYELIAFESEEELEKGARQYVNENNLLAGVHFINFPTNRKRRYSDELDIPHHVEYKIRMSVDQTVVPSGLYNRVKKSSPDDDFLDSLRYFWGFLAVQDLVDRAVIKLTTGNDTHEMKTYTQAFPYPCYDQDDFMVWSSFVIVVILLFSWLCMMAVGITSSVSEKENGIEDTMLVMGMRGSVNRFAWFVNTLLGMIFLSAFVTALIIGGNLTRFSDPLLVFLWLSTYSVSIVMLCYLVSALVHRTNLASLIGLLVYIVLCMPFIILHSMDVVFQLGFREKVLMSLSVTSAFCFGANELLVTEKNGMGITWERAFTPTGDSFPFAWACIMSTFDSMIYGLIAWYVSNKFPGEHGIPQPWYFPVSPYFWGLKKRRVNDVDLMLLENKSKNKRRREDDNEEEEDPPWRSDQIQQSRKFMVKSTVPGEKEPENLPVGITLSKLTKCFKEGKKKAVDDLTVNFFKGQITAFLGHNGAGKSTCIKMLTGLTPPTSGTAYIGGRDIRDGFDEIRSSLGYCPQHDVLFDYMTIKEHFDFYARMKADISKVVISDAVKDMLDLTGLTKFKDVPVNHLSGGQRRRVSVGCAFIGDSQYIILDEPTSGVDPAARRMIWDIIVKHKTNRTIILCTHHLDEADVLGDRIVIIHQGRLITTGSSLWLKTNFGSGYQLTISKATAGLERGLGSHRDSQSGKWNTERLLNFIKELVPKAQVTEEIGTEVTIVLPTDRRNSTRLRELFIRLEARHAKYMIDKYGIADSTLEEVFLKVTHWATKHPNRPLQPELIKAQILQGTRESENEPAGEEGYDNDAYDEISYHGRSSRNHSSVRSSSSMSSESIYIGNYDRKQLDKTRSRGFALTWRQFKALLTKRFHHYKRDLKSHVSQIVLPSVFVCIAMVATMFKPELGQVDPYWIDASIYGPNQTILYSMHNETPFATAMVDTLKTAPGMGTNCLKRTAINIGNWNYTKKTCHSRDVDFELEAISRLERLKYENPPNCTCDVDGPWHCPDNAAGQPAPRLKTHTGEEVVDLTNHQFGIEQYSLRKFDQFSDSDATEPIWGGWTFDTEQEEVKSTVWFNSKGIHAVPSFLNALNNMALRANVQMRKDTLSQSNESDVSNYDEDDPSEYGITVHNHPFNASDWPISTSGLFMKFSDTGVSLTIMIAYCFVPATYVIYVIKERTSQEKRLQAITGVGTFLYWSNALLWDMVTYMITMSLTVGIVRAFNLHVFTYGENLHALGAILALFGWATIPMMYLVSRWFDNPTTGYVAAFIINLAIGINCTACIFFLQTPIFNSRKGLVAAREILTKAFLIFPQFCLGDAMVKIAYNQIITDIFIRFNINDYTSPFDKSLLFYHYLVLAVEGVLLFLIHLVIEFDLCDFSTKRKAERKPSYKEDADVSKERLRVTTNPNLDANLATVYKLSKYYRRRFRNILAVDNLCLGIPRGECFGLLGINGAGKTTTFKMITGEIQTSSGAVFLNGEIVSEDVSNMNQNVGYCPQFDALDDFLTGDEMIYYYCRLRGIPEGDLSGICAELTTKFGLEQHIKNTVRTYSAGNKRKLSMALALIGDPELVLLDEPTTGMDPGTRRLVWDNITAIIKDGRSVILTSHSMEECDALCTRMAIMVNGRFRCMGSSQHLKNKFGSGYTMSCRVGGDRGTAKKVISFMKRTFKGSYVKDRHLNMLEFGIPARSNTLAALFGGIEDNKDKLKIDNFSVTQTTLDNVFLNFAKQQNDDRVFNSMEDFNDIDDSDTETMYDMEDSTASSSGVIPESSAPPSYHQPGSIAPNPYNIPHISRDPSHSGNSSRRSSNRSSHVSSNRSRSRSSHRPRSSHRSRSSHRTRSSHRSYRRSSNSDYSRGSSQEDDIGYSVSRSGRRRGSSRESVTLSQASTGSLEDFDV